MIYFFKKLTIKNPGNPEGSPGNTPSGRVGVDGFEPPTLCL